MKKQKQLLFGLTVTSFMALSQTPSGTSPTPFPAGNAPQTQNLANNAWFKGGAVKELLSDMTKRGLLMLH